MEQEGKPREKLRMARAEKGWSLEQVGEAVGVGWNTVSLWELGKATPHARNVYRLCKLYGRTAEELDLAAPRPALPVMTARKEVFARQLSGVVRDDLTMRLLALGFVALPLAQLQAEMKRILEEDESMNHDPISRRAALRRLATALGMTYLNPQSPLPFELNSDLLRQTAACLAACWELSRSKERGDIRTAFGSANTYAQMLKALIKEASSNQQRQESASLIAQCEILLTILSWHFVNLETAARHAKEAVAYSELSGDIPLHLDALKQQAWMHYYSQRSAQALKSIGQATLVLKEHKNNLPQYTHSDIYSSLALMQASNGQDASAELRYAEKMLSSDDAPIYVDAPISGFIHKVGVTLYEQGDYGQAMTLLEQLIDIDRLTAKQPMPERSRVEVINNMALISLKQAKKDRDLSLRLWTEGINGARALHSEQRYREALLAYEIMQSLWPGEDDIRALRELVVHW
jgi:transcriptional regulator with XRE-family HTH domain/tetratricopeptide (TPR) repeat protein